MVLSDVLLKGRAEGSVWPVSRRSFVVNANTRLLRSPSPYPSRFRSTETDSTRSRFRIVEPLPANCKM